MAMVHGIQYVVDTEGSYVLALRPTIRGIPETMVCRILMFMWCFGLRLCVHHGGGVSVGAVYIRLGRFV